ncbi:MAG: DUF1961 family protein [Prolixibacteraceae bacterium]|nr:DUF1961 family protein [Prolixibacteraceae bacterium]
MKKVLLLTILAFMIQFMNAAIKLPALISSDMVLQRNTNVKLWGWANPNEVIKIKTSWLKGALKTETDQEGNWMVELPTNNSRKPQTIIIKGDGSEITLQNVVFGEVWLCSGQSNMYQPLKGYGNNQPTRDAMLAKVKATNSKVRIFSVNRTNSIKPINELKGYNGWQESSPKNIDDFSAVAWFFGQQLQEILDVPVGMIHSSWGGTRVESWMSKEVLEQFQTVDLSDVELKESSKRYPSILYNAMIHPLIPYTIKGALWYQGEANRKNYKEYKELFPAMVNNWRSKWGIGNFPFYFVQIAPYNYDLRDHFADINNNSAFMRAAQVECLDLIPNSGIAITTDIGDKNRIHPANKKEVANRLLYNALEQTYGMKGIDGKSPKYKSMKIRENEIHLEFEHAENGLFAFDALKAFEIAGNDRVFYPAMAKIVNDTMVEVKSTKVTEPLAVRYAWDNWVKGTLYDRSFLPASSFRTDDWETASRHTDGLSEQAIDALRESSAWELKLEDDCTYDWTDSWTLDGLIATVENSDKGMHFSAGPEFKNDAHHAVMWTKESFTGNVKIEYDYTRTDSETSCVNILYIQATGDEEGPYKKDISNWRELREVPAMKTYFENMNALHISYAAFVNTADTAMYVRARRYPKPDGEPFDVTKIPPSYDYQGYFKTGETYRITVIKTDHQLFFQMENNGESKLFTWDLSEIDPVNEGRIGLRHMYTRSAIYRNFRIYTE